MKRSILVLSLFLVACCGSRVAADPPNQANPSNAANLANAANAVNQSNGANASNTPQPLPAPMPAPQPDPTIAFAALEKRVTASDAALAELREKVANGTGDPDVLAKVETQRKAADASVAEARSLVAEAKQARADADKAKADAMKALEDANAGGGWVGIIPKSFDGQSLLLAAMAAIELIRRKNKAKHEKQRAEQMEAAARAAEERANRRTADAIVAFDDLPETAHPLEVKAAVGAVKVS